MLRGWVHSASTSTADAGCSPASAKHTWKGVDVPTNALGFRDRAHDFVKPKDITRVAVLGDSFIEAVQVPLAQTATQVLEQRLNAAAGADKSSQRWEVLNFGVSNYGIGQYLLMWEEYTRRFDPDYVVLFVAKLHMRRTVSKYEYGAFTATKSDELWVRPTFRLENDVLVREPARDYDQFVAAQDELTKGEFGGQRTRRRETPLVTLYYARFLWDKAQTLVHHARQPTPEATPRSGPPSAADAALFALNAKIIEALGSSVRSAGGKLIVVDASQYFEKDENVPKLLEALCAQHDFGYVPAYRQLNEAKAKGIATRWVHDVHFTETGNSILASALYDWFAQGSRAGRIP